MSDDGRGMTTEELAKLKKRLKEDEEVIQESGFGVVNVNQRIHSYYGEEYGIFYESREGERNKGYGSNSCKKCKRRCFVKKHTFFKK